MSRFRTFSSFLLSKVLEPYPQLARPEHHVTTKALLYTQAAATTRFCTLYIPAPPPATQWRLNLPLPRCRPGGQIPLLERQESISNCGVKPQIEISLNLRLTGSSALDPVEGESGEWSEARPYSGISHLRTRSDRRPHTPVPPQSPLGHFLLCPHPSLSMGLRPQS